MELEPKYNPTEVEAGQYQNGSMPASLSQVAIRKPNLIQS